MLEYLYYILQHCVVIKLINISMMKKLRKFGFQLSNLGTESEIRKFHASLEVGNIDEAKKWINALILKIDRDDPIIAQALALLRAKNKEIELSQREIIDGKITTITMSSLNDPDLEPTEICL